MYLFSKKYDKWTLERIARHVAYWCFWWAFYVVANSSSYGNEDYLSWFLLELFILPVKLFFVYFVVYYLLPRFSKRKEYLKLLLFTVGLAILCGVILIFLDLYVVSEHLFGAKGMRSKLGVSHFLSGKIIYKSLDLLFIVSLVISIKFIQQQIQHERKTKDLLTQKLRTELQFLKHQLQPHFLFNTLNNLYGMILTKNQNAGDVVIKLSEIMNYMLYESNDTMVPIEKELESLSHYIELEKIRYGDELEVQTNIQGDTRNKKIPPLLLIPFVENAFKHGVSGNTERSWIEIYAEISDSRFVFKITNSLPSPGKSQTVDKPGVNSGIGLTNVRKRLELIYGDAYDLNIIASDMYTVELYLNQWINGNAELFDR